jgi:hypothetical protein
MKIAWQSEVWQVIECCETYLEARPNVYRSWKLLWHFLPAPAAGMNSQPLEKRRGCSSIHGVTGALAITIAAMLLIRPWAVHIGGRWTPALVWHGAGTLQSTTGAKYGIFLDLSMSSARKSRRDFMGTAKICTPQGEIYPLSIDGYLKRAWLDVEGKPVTFYLSNPKDARPRLNFSLFGAWHGQQLSLDDKGSMAMSFSPDGRAKGYLAGANSAQETTTGMLHYATEAEFTAACGAKHANSF